VEVLLQTYIRVLQLKNNEENEKNVCVGNVKESHLKIVQSQQAVGSWQDNGVRG
jgi:hypothetical protein